MELGRVLKVLTHLGSVAALPLCFSLSLGACDKRTAEEKGRDYAAEKVGFAEGAAKVLREKGKGLGESVGKGIGDLVKGTGTAIKDVAHPPVSVTAAPDLSPAGIRILQAHEGKDGSHTRSIVVYLQFPKPFSGRLQLRAFGSENSELGRSNTTSNLTQEAGSSHTSHFAFPGDFRLSKVDHYLLHGLDAKRATLAAGLEGMEVSQLNEDGTSVSVYLVFSRAFSGGLQLRAYDQTGTELGRSDPTEKLAQRADSSTHISVSFDTKTPLASAVTYTLHRVKPRQPVTPPAKSR